MNPRWRRYLHFFGPNVERDIDDELGFHLAMRIEEYEQLGMLHADAERAARERFGDTGAIAEALRAHDDDRARRARRHDHMLNLRQDLRFAARTLRRSPGWALAVVLTLALGIGLSTAVFTIAQTVLLRPLPVRAQDRLVVLWGVTRDGKTDHFPLLYRDARQYARTTQTLAQVAFFSYGGAQAVPIDMGANITRMHRALVSGNYFAVLGTRPLMGRALRPTDDRTGAAPVAVLSYIGWQRFFGGDPRALGRRVVLHVNGTAYTIVGVMPRGLDYPRGADFWTPVVPNSYPLGDQPIYAELNVVGRLRPGASIADARAELTRFFGVIGPRWNVVGVARSFTEDVVGDVGPAILAFAAAAALLLLMTCINVANLLLVRGMTRARELALRTALGAARGRLVLQLLTESTLLALVGGFAGALFAAAAVRGFVHLAPAGTPRVNEIHVGASLVALASAVTAAATLLFALAPTLVSARADVGRMLRAGARQSGESRGVRVGTQALIVGQMALALVVLCMAGLLVRSLVALENVHVAVDPHRLLVAELALPRTASPDARQQMTLIEDVLQRVSALPGVRSVAPTYTAPFAPIGGVFGRIAAEGQSAGDAARDPLVDYELVTPGSFATLGIRVLRGRAFTNDDRAGEPPVAIVSESEGRTLWPGADPIGKRFAGGPNPGLTVVGVVGDTHYRDLRAARPRVYLPLRQSPFSSILPTTLLVATDGDAADMVASVRHAARDAAPGVALAGAAPLASFLDDTLAQPRLDAMLLGLFAGAALLLAAVGLFGVMATSVRQRTRELAVRMALGASPSALRRMVLTRALLLASIGLALGLAASLVATRAVGALLFRVSPTDAPSLAIAGALLAGVALLAAYLPARRAQRVDPILSLRAD